MVNESDWYNVFVIELEKATFTRRELKLFNIDRFKKSAKWVDLYSLDCPVCKEVKPEMLYAAKEITNMSGSPGAGEVEFESLNDKVYHHLRKDHLLMPRSYFVAFYSLLGMVAGTVTGGIVGLLGNLISSGVQGIWLKNGLLIGWFAGLIAGQILGKRKDNRIEKQGRQF